MGVVLVGVGGAAFFVGEVVSADSADSGGSASSADSQKRGIAKTKKREKC